MAADVDRRGGASGGASLEGWQPFLSYESMVVYYAIPAIYIYRYIHIHVRERQRRNREGEARVKRDMAVEAEVESAWDSACDSEKPVPRGSSKLCSVS